ncbi:MAG: isoprenyl transferase [Bacteroidaceae bacterium]|nr:isoprenyl transferase [Bacteroidaceae bacterium]
MIELDKNRIPGHIAIIMDGNGRWAKAKGQPRAAGHVQGVEAVRVVTEECVRLGVKYLTLYTFSTENWNRPVEEVKALMELLLKNLEDEIFMKNNVRFRVIGDRYRLPREVQDKISEMEQSTAHNDAMTLVLAISYSARWEIARACRQIYIDMQAPCYSGKTEDDINERFVASYMQTSFMPDPDLLIRTGGEQRISNFLLWQIAYAELYFCDTFWPDFGAEELQRAIADYQNRERRFGKTSEQIKEQA